MGFADLHIHTIHSFDGTCAVSAILKFVANYTDLNVIAITDHNTMEGVGEAMELAPAYGIEVIPGCEISTADGHLLALFINRPIPAGLSLVKTVRLVREQNGVCIAAHPNARGADSLQFSTIRRALLNPEVQGTLLGIEAFNGGLGFTRRNAATELIAKTFPLAQVGNSDAHVLETLGQGSSEFPGATAMDLRAALENATTRVRKGVGLDGYKVLRNYLPRYFLRKLGWVAYNADPMQPLTYARINKALNRYAALS
jgi:predicted metal-dependent phosphoesterase TrpH